METLEQVYKKIQKYYKQQSRSESPKYLKYITIAFGGVGLLIVRQIFWKLLHKSRSYPPGPVGLPFLGCLLHFGATPRRFLVNIANTYGPITYVPLLTSRNVFISDPKLLRKLYQNEKIIDHADFKFRRNPSIGELNGSEWSKRKKFMLTSVLNVTNTSFVLSHTKQCFVNDIEPMINEQHIENKQLWYPKKCLNLITMNTIFSAVFGQLLPCNHPFIAKFGKADQEAVERMTVLIMLDAAISGLNVKLPDWIYEKLMWHHAEHEHEGVVIEWMKNNGFIVDVERNILRRTRENQTSESNVYIDFVISKLNENKITVDAIIGDIATLLGAAIDTTSKSSEYGFLLLARNQDIQEKINQELMDVMKKHNLKEFDFKILNELHIFRAFIYEVLRISSVTPTGLPHITSKDHMIEVNGRKVVIPSKTTLHSNTYYMHKYLDWNDPNKVFKQENNSIHLEYWLDEQGRFKMNDNFVLFGVGRRNCVGQSLAMKAMYAIFGIMMTKYRFRSTSNEMNIMQTWDFVMKIDPPIPINIELR